MAVTDTSHENPTRFFGLSTDTKPTSAMVDSTFYETDTRYGFLYDGANWTRSEKVTVEQVGTITVNEVRATSVILEEILLQLRINNAHLEMVTGEAINEEDLDVTN